MHKIRPVKKEDHKDVVVLLNQLVKNPASFNYFSDWNIGPVIDDPNCHCVVVEHEGKVIGFGALVIFLTPAYGYKGRIEDVVVHQDHRGKGLGKELSKELINIAKKNNVRSVYLTSQPSRIPARRLYESLGFVLRDTGEFKLNL